MTPLYVSSTLVPRQQDKNIQAQKKKKNVFGRLVVLLAWHVYVPDYSVRLLRAMLRAAGWSSFKRRLNHLHLSLQSQGVGWQSSFISSKQNYKKN
jgi:hypothetical protein